MGFLYVRNNAIKNKCKKLNKRVGIDFLFYLDSFIDTKLEEACKVHNGGKKTLDKSVASYILGGKKK